MSRSNRTSIIDSTPGESTSLKRKLVAVGDGNCGKTCLLSVFTKGEFPVEYQSYFDNFQEYQMDVDNKKLYLTLVDAIEAYSKLYPLFCRNADVILLCFSIGDPTSLKNVLDNWKFCVLEEHCPDAPILLVGNKLDLRQSDVVQGQTVSYEDGLDIARKIGALAYYECSAKTGEGVQEVFQAAAKIAVHANKRPDGKKRCILS